jgi:hypothetical protein
MSQAADLLRQHTQKGKSVGKHDQGDAEHPYSLGVVEDEVFVVNEDYQPYKPVIQRIRKKDDSTVYRLCYFVITKNGKPGFGQFAPMVNGEDLCALINQAVERHWPGFENINSK